MMNFVNSLFRLRTFEVHTTRHEVCADQNPKLSRTEGLDLAVGIRRGLKKNDIRIYFEQMDT